MKQIYGVVFDLYGTLYDVHSVSGLCDAYYPGRGQEISILWRQKQLEYTWLRSLMGQYVNFEVATSDALVFTCNRLQLPLVPPTHEALCNKYLEIEPYPEVSDALTRLREMGLLLAILSNGSVTSIQSVVSHSALGHHFSHLISADEVQIYKPHNRVYELGERYLGFDRSNILFVSSNGWDASGGRHFGYPVCWVNRAGNVFEELGQSPDHIFAGLDELADWLQHQRKEVD